LIDGLVRRRVVVQGIVQGVFFRESTRRLARQLGVSGWARNRPDGTVEAVFEGPINGVERMLEFVRTGPPQAHVAQVEAFEEEPEGLSGFEIR
jgi:acylphosphatase